MTGLRLWQRGEGCGDSQLADGVALVESFSHVLLIDTGEGLVAFDSSGPGSGRDVVKSIRRWSNEPVDTLVYTHGHVDHVGGSRAFAADAEAADRPLPTVVGHRNLAPRLDRYDATNGYNLVINNRQFGGSPVSALRSADDRPERRFVPEGTLRPDVEYASEHTLTVGGTST